MSEPAYTFGEQDQQVAELPEQGGGTLEFLQEAARLPNIAAEMEEQQKSRLVSVVLEEVRADDASMADWLQDIEGSLKLAMMTHEVKQFPWHGASNVKLPLIMKVALKFAARAYAKLLSGTDWVKSEHPGAKYADPEQANVLDLRSKRVAAYMNYQLQHEIEGWEQEFDLLLHMLPWVGCLHRKTYFNPGTQACESELVMPTELIVNQGARKKAHTRYTHKIQHSSDRYHELVESGVFLPVNVEDNSDSAAPDSDKINDFYQVHGFWDLDGDGYREPYVMTIHRGTESLVHMQARFDPADIIHRNGTVQRVPAIQHFTRYGFYPAPDGSYWQIGWGHMLRGLNEAGNTMTNQLIDAGTLQNANPGVVSDSLRLVRSGSWKFKPGEWKRVRGTMGPLGNAFYPIPVGQPSQVLFAMLEKFDSDISQLAMTPDMVAENTASTAPVGTTLARLEEAERVSNAVDKRIYKSMSAEFKVLYWLNGAYLDPQNYVNILNIQVPSPEMALQVVQKDFERDSIDLLPTANPEASSRTVRIAQMDFVISTALQFAQLDAQAAGRINVDAIQKEAWAAAGIQNPEELLPPPPTPEQEEQQESVNDAKELMMQAEVETAVAKAEEAKEDARAATEEVKKIRAETQLLIEQTVAQRIESDIVANGVDAFLEQDETAE